MPFRSSLTESQEQTEPQKKPKKTSDSLKSGLNPKYYQPTLSPVFKHSPKYQKLKYIAPTTKHYFAYGSNLNRARMAQRGVIWENAQRGILNNYKLDFAKEANLLTGEGYATIKESKGNRVEGIIYRLEDRDMTKKLDAYEGTELDQYKRIEITVLLKSKKTIRCFTYIACKRYKGLLPSKTYITHVLEGRHYLTNEYYQWLKGFGHTIDKPCRVFVYGTLKTGYRNNHLITKHSDKEDAEVNGNLYIKGLPYASVDDANIFHEATGRIQEDYKQQELLQKDLDHGHYWTKTDQNNYIEGELYTFNNWDILQVLDRLEGFTPGNSRSHYHRILTSCHSYGGVEDHEYSCWIYISKEEFEKEYLAPQGLYTESEPVSYKQLYNSSPIRTWQEEHDSKFHNENYDLEKREEEEYLGYDPDIDPSWGEDTSPEDKEALKSLFQKGKL